ncbi:MAG: acyl-CoA dehydrogenase [Myxococcota bacterium]|nr:acyl-CoA dehydrogenase [Myxococcota bacterium]
MSVANHYKSNLRDILFNLFEVNDIGNTVLSHPRFSTMDEDSARDALTGIETFAHEVFQKAFVPSDRTPITLDSEGNVTIPKELIEVFNRFYEDGWHMFEVPEHLEGFNAPPSLVWSAFEMQAGACASATFYLFGVYIARIIDRLGTDSQKARYVKNMLDRRWGGCMVLTEPDAGSDVGAGRTKARHIEGDVWELEGVKRFITNGDFETENIVHLVLARPEGGDVGTKGLSMFIVPKFWVNEDGSIGERNGAFVTNVEKKMGLHGSCTCELTLGDRMQCRGLLVGEVHNGIRQMFHVIEHARMAVGIKSVSTISTAYLNALAYAKDRVQGPDLAKAMDKTSERVRIIEHPDVRRMLLELKSHTEGMRALALHTAHVQDKVQILGGHGSPDARRLDRLNDLLLPLVKGYCSHRGYALLGDALQIFGGSGYVSDYPMEQYIRDQKIDTLYEGTTHIQALDLLFRKVMRDGGKTLMGLMTEIQATLSDAETVETLAVERAAMTRAMGDVQGMLMTLQKKVGESIYHAGLQGNRILFALAETVIGWLLVKHSVVAHQRLPHAKGKDVAFYKGKIASARWYCENVLPGLTLTRKLIENGTLQAKEVPEDAF